MADEIQGSPAPEATSVAAPETGAASTPATPVAEPTAAQAEGSSLVKKTSREIDDLWAKVEGRAAPEATPEPTNDDVAAPATRTRDEHGRFIKAEAPAPEPAATEAATPEATTSEAAPPAVDHDAIERQVRDRIEAESRAKQEAEQKVRAEAEYRSTYEAYIGRDDDYSAVNAALRAAQRGDDGALDALDVVLPNGKRVSQVRADGLKGLTAAEASQLLDTWDQNRSYEDVMGTRKVQQILSYWDAQTQQALGHPDVDAAKVREHRTPGDQMKAAIETSVASAERRKDAEYAPKLAAKDSEIEKLTQRVASLTNERGNLTSQQLAARAASPDRPGAPGAVPRELPTPDQLRDMSPEDAFKSGAIDRLFQLLPGGAVPTRRRTG